MATSFSKRMVGYFVLASCLASFPLRAADLAAEDQRMVAVAKLWRDVKWLHPALARGEVDWDAALVASLPKIQAARTPAELKLALGELMAPLHDPSVRLEPEAYAGPVKSNPSLPPLEWLEGDVALLHLHHTAPRLGQDDPAVTAAIVPILDRAKALVVDLRSAAFYPGAPLPLDLNTLAARLIDKPLWLPATRVRTHSGYAPQSGATSGGYFSAFETRDTVRLTPTPGGRPIPAVFIVNNMRLLPPAVLALQRAGKAFIVAQGTPSPNWLARPRSQPIDAGTVVQFNPVEMMFEDGSSGFGADAVMPADPATGADSGAVLAALAALRSGHTPGADVRYAHLPLIAARKVEDAYARMIYPDLAWRQLAVVKLWAIADAFFPYKQYMDAPWSDALPIYLKRMADVKNAREYALAIAAMANRLGDNHVSARNAETERELGWYNPGIRVAQVEGRSVVAGFASEEVAQTSGLTVGDVIVSVDGEDAPARLARIAEVTGGSRDEMKLHRAQAYLLAASEKTAATLRIEDAGGQLREVGLGRKLWQGTGATRSGPVVQVLAGNVGYADLDRLEPAGVDAMFDKVQATRALILDMRGYPRGTGMALAARLNVKGATVGAKFRRPSLSALDVYPGQTQAFDQLLFASAKPLYRGKVVMLIDARTISQSEHVGLFVEAATPVTFIGSRSSGANGDVTNTVLPGNIRVSFTGQEVLHSDGRQLQRVGIEPDIAVAPTLKGLRAGRDEVLERALAFIETGK